MDRRGRRAARGVAVVALSALLVVAGVGLLPATAEAATPVDQCREINESVVPADRTVLVNQSLTATGTCFEVATSDVTLDGQGNTLTGDGTGTGIAVENASTSLSNVTVRNVTVRNFEDGAGVVDATGVTLADVNASANGEDGLRTDDSTAGLVVRDSVLSGNGNSGADTSAQATFENVTANDNANGLFVRGTGSVIRNATVSDNVFRGIGVSAPDSTVADSTVTNANAALRVYAGETNTTVRNVTIQNGWAAFESENNTVSGLTVVDSNFYGIEVTAANNELRGLTVRNAGTAGASDGIRVVDGADGTLVADSTVTGSSAENVNVTAQGTVTIRNLTSTDASIDGVSVGEVGGTSYGTTVVVEASNLSANGVYGVSGIGATNVTVRDSLVESNNFEGISAGRTNTVVENVTVRDNGLEGITADLAVDQTVDISLTVRNSTVTGTSSFPGIAVANVDALEVTDTTVSGFADDGIAVGPAESTVPDAVLRNVTVTGVTGDGISLANATNASVAASEVTGVGEDGVNVTAADVTLDDLTLDSNGRFGVRSTAAADGLVVRNATITDHTASPYAAALLNGTTTVENVTVENNRQGLRMEGADSVVSNSTFAGNIGHVTVNADRVTVRDSSVDGGANVRMFAGTDSVVANVTFTGGGYLVDDGATGTTFRNVTVTAPGAQEGILLNGATDTLVVDSSVTGGSASGVELGGTANATLRNVTLANNADGVTAAGPGDATGLTVEDSSIRNHTGEGLSTFDDATVRDSAFDDNGGAGVSVRAVATLSNTTVGNTTFASATLSNVDATNVTNAPASPSGLNDADAYVDLTATSGSSYADVVVAYTDADVSGTPGVNESTLDLYNYDGSTWTAVGGSTLDTAANTVSANVTSFSTFAPLGDEQTVVTQCRQINESVVPASRTVYLGANVSGVGTGDGCLVVTASDVTLDGQGYVVDGSGGGNNGILVGNASGTSTNVTIRNVEVSGYLSDAINTSATGTVVENATLTSYDNGIDADAPTAVRNTTVESTTSGEGILSEGDLTVRDSTVVDNGDDGIYVTGPGMILTDVTVRNNDAYGIDGDDDVLVRDVVSENNVEDGIYADDNTTVENVSLLNNDGWGIDAGSDVSIRDTRVVGNDDEGIEVDDDALIQNVVVRGSDDEGIYGGDNVTVRNALVENNSNEGIYVSDDATLVNVTIRDNDGWGVEAIDDGVARDVISTGNDGDGLYLDDRADVQNVTVRDNDGAGVNAGDSSTVMDVLAVNNSDEGVEVDDDSVVENVVVRDGRDYGIDGGTNATVRDAVVENNTEEGVIVEDDSTLANITVRDNGVDVGIDGTGVSATDLTLGTTRLAAAQLANVDLNATGTAPAPPSGLLDVGAYVEMTDRTASAYADVTVAYTDAGASGVDESSLALYRHDGTAWTAVGGSAVDTNANTVSANATAFSVFAPLGPEAAGDDVTGPTGDVEVTDAGLSTTSVETGESVTVSATVENTQGATAAKTLRLRVDGVSAGQQTVYVPADTNETYEFTYAPSRTGEYGVTVNGLDAGTLAVSEPAAGGGGSSVVGGAETPTPTDGSDGAATPTDGSDGAATSTDVSGGGAATPTDGNDGGAATPTETSPVTATDDGGATPTAASGGEGEANTPAPTEGGGPGFGAVAALVALLAAALVAARRRG